MKARIIKRENPEGKVTYVIQQKHCLFRWCWVDASYNTDLWCTDTFYTLEEAQKKLNWFDGTKWKEEVVQ